MYYEDSDNESNDIDTGMNTELQELQRLLNEAVTQVYYASGQPFGKGKVALSIWATFGQFTTNN